MAKLQSFLRRIRNKYYNKFYDRIIEKHGLSEEDKFNLSMVEDFLSKERGKRVRIYPSELSKENLDILLKAFEHMKMNQKDIRENSKGNSSG